MARAERRPIPFVIVTSARSGSWHLVELINHHPDVVCNGEPLNREDPTWPRERMSTEELLAHGYTGGLRRGPKPERPLAAGFKVLLENLVPDEFSGLLPAILGWPELRVVILRRDNMLEAYRSRAQADASGVWQKVRADDEWLQPAVTLSPDRCRAYFEQVETFFDQVRAIARRRPLLEITYEQLLTEPAKTLGRVWALLEVDRHPLAPSPLFRQERRALDQTVANYAEVRAAFAGTRYARFFPN